jgi:hypothetical protein
MPELRTTRVASRPGLARPGPPAILSPAGDSQPRRRLVASPCPPAGRPRAESGPTRHVYPNPSPAPPPLPFTGLSPARDPSPIRSTPT